MAKNSKTIRKTIPKLTSDPVTKYREWYNNYLLKIQGKKNVLDIGKSLFWDYSVLFDKYTSIDNSRDAKPDILCSIFENKLKDESFDVVLCNGMHESCSDRIEQLVEEVYRLLKPRGIAVFGFCGKNYPISGVEKFDGRDLFGKYKTIDEENFNGEYYYTVCLK